MISYINRSSYATIALLLFVQLVVASEKLISPESVGGLTGSELCNLDDKRLSHISTINKLLAAFESNEDLACRNVWLNPLKDLQNLIEASAIDACSLNTIKKIEEFHWRYVIGALSRSWRDASEDPIPEPLGLFFIHFVMETMEQCKSSVGSRLDEALAAKPVETTSLTGGSLGAMLRTLSVALVPDAKIKNFDDFFFIFDAIINNERKKGYIIEETIPDSKTGEVTYLHVKLNDATKTHELQERCKQQLRPLYSNTVQPLMRLIDLGFGTSGQRFYNHEKLLAEWYEITQFCELLLPVKFHSSQDVKKGQASLVKDPEEIKLLNSQQAATDFHGGYPARVEVTGVILNDAIPLADDDSVVKRVKASFRSRTRVHRKTLKNALKTFRSEIGSRLKRFFGSKKHNNNFVVEKDDAELETHLAEAEKSLAKEEMEDREPDVGQTNLVRHKRETDFAKSCREMEERERKRQRRHSIMKTIISIIVVLAVLGAFVAIILVGLHII